MRTIDLDQQIKSEELRQREKALVKKEHKIRRRVIHKSKPSTVHNTYTLFISGVPTDKQLEMDHLEALVMNRALKDKFCAHVRSCLDAGIQNKEKLSEWRCTEHWSRKLKAADANQE